MAPSGSTERRDFLVRAGTLAGLLLPGAVSGASALPASAVGKEKWEEDIPPTEDLMREHGLLNRILLIYDEHLRRLDSKQDFDPGVLASAADIIRRFVEEYHEKLEEDYLFPRFRKAGKLVDLVDVLLQQHQAGRRLTARIIELANRSSLKNPDGRDRLSSGLRSFVRMYRPHEAREDTILFPAFRTVVSPHEYDSLGEDFEKKEDQLFGDHGYERMVERVADLERKLGIYELSQFTPK